MTLVTGILDNDKKNVSNFKNVETGNKISTSVENGSGKEKLKAELKEALNDAFDIIEGIKPRKTLKDIFNG